MKFFIMKWHRIISSAFSCFINSVGLILAIVGVCIGFDTKKTYQILIILLIAEFFLIFSVIYSISSMYKDKSSQVKIEDKRIELERIAEANRTIFENNKSIITTYKDSSDILEIKLHNYLCNNQRLNSLNGQTDSGEKTIEEYNKLDDTAKKRISEYVRNERKKEYDAFRETLVYEYNRFLGNITNILRRNLEELLSTKKCQNSVSVTVKQLERPELFSLVGQNKTLVYTAFRDYRTYNRKKRIETWQKGFSIHKNSDFSNSVEKEYYIFNFLEKKHLEQGLYQNENASFYEDYNSGITCTIHSCINGERKLFGYLACDSLFDERIKKKCGKDIFDWNAANLMMYAAHVIAMYLEKFLNIWDSYCVDFDMDDPILVRCPELLFEKEAKLKEQLIEMKEALETTEDNETKSSMECRIQKINNELFRLSSKGFCNYMIQKVNSTRFNN